MPAMHDLVDVLAMQLQQRMLNISSTYTKSSSYTSSTTL
jgi:hypothetical protein